MSTIARQSITAAYRVLTWGDTEKFRAADSKSWKINSLVIPTVAFSAFFSVSLTVTVSADLQRFFDATHTFTPYHAGD